MKFVYFHNWYYASSESGERRAKEAAELIKKNLDSFPFKEKDYEIAAAEAKSYSSTYWLLLFLVSSVRPSDDSQVSRQRIQTWLDSIDVFPSDDRSVMTAKYDTLQECVDAAYPGAYTVHTLVRSGDIVTP